MITERAMLAAVHISIWTAVKHDRKISREVAEQRGVYAGAGRYNQQLPVQYVGIGLRQCAVVHQSQSLAAASASGLLKASILAVGNTG